MQYCSSLYLILSHTLSSQQASSDITVYLQQATSTLLVLLEFRPYCTEQTMLRMKVM
jgi:hypothetical protein